MTRFIPLALVLLAAGASLARAQEPPGPPSNPFAPPRAKVFYAPDRDYDLQHVAVDLRVDYAAFRIDGRAQNTLAPLRDGLTQVRLHCGDNLQIASCEIDGQKAAFARKGDLLAISAPQPLPRGKTVVASVRYRGGAKQGESFGSGGGGFHWIKREGGAPDRVGFWTQGESEYTRQWAPIWDYPNDFATSETRTTVPADWYVIGNGTLTSQRVSTDGKTRTFHWEMKQPHATYLLSLAGGPFAVKTASWQGVPLLYVTPKSLQHLIDDSFGDTPEMLTFFSKVTGVPYPWPKYAQSAMYDFGGGMENVSATTLGEGSLTDRREGFRHMASLNAHELAHQWFGNLVTCKDWGHIWLNESFATFFQALYFEHSRGKNAYHWEIEDNTQDYLRESRRYKRPLATNLYPEPDEMFDSHTYPNGAVILHTLRRQLGDEAFFRGIQHYLTRHRHTPVESKDLCRALTESSGINVEPFFDQWIFKPGHPVLDYWWTWDDAKKEVVLTVRQIQDTKDGTPVYDLRPTVGLIAGGKVTRRQVAADKVDQEIRLAVESRPDAVILDPDHDFLREIPKPRWSPEELLAVLRYAPGAPDRSAALQRLLEGTPSDAVIAQIAAAIRDDRDPFPALRLPERLGRMKRADLRPLYRALLTHPDAGRRAQAVRFLGQLPKDPADMAALRSLVSDTSPYAVVGAAVTALAAWDAAANQDVLQKAAQMPSRRETIRRAALVALARSKSQAGIPLLIQAAGPNNPPALRQAALEGMGQIDAEPRTRAVLGAALRDKSARILFAAAQAIGRRKDRALLADLKQVQKNPPAGVPDWMKRAMGAVVQELEKAPPAKPASR